MIKVALKIFSIVLAGFGILMSAGVAATFGKQPNIPAGIIVLLIAGILPVFLGITLWRRANKIALRLKSKQASPQKNDTVETTPNNRLGMKKRVVIPLSIILAMILWCVIFYVAGGGKTSSPAESSDTQALQTMAEQQEEPEAVTTIENDNRAEEPQSQQAKIEQPGEEITLQNREGADQPPSEQGIPRQDAQEVTHQQEEPQEPRAGAVSQPVQPQISQTSITIETIVYVTRTGNKYHRDGCSYLRKSKSAIQLGNAVRTYEPCSRCRPPVIR